MLWLPLYLQDCIQLSQTLVLNHNSFLSSSAWVNWKLLFTQTWPFPLPVLYTSSWQHPTSSFRNWSLGAVLSSSSWPFPHSSTHSIVTPRLPHLLSIFCTLPVLCLPAAPHPSFNASSSFSSLCPVPLTPRLSAHSDRCDLVTTLKTSVPPKCLLTEGWIKKSGYVVVWWNITQLLKRIK